MDKPYLASVINEDESKEDELIEPFHTLYIILDELGEIDQLLHAELAAMRFSLLWDSSIFNRLKSTMPNVDLAKKFETMRAYLIEAKKAPFEQVLNIHGMPFDSDIAIDLVDRISEIPDRDERLHAVKLFIHKILMMTHEDDVDTKDMALMAFNLSLTEGMKHL